MSDKLHHDNGTHRWTAATADGHDVELHEAAIRRHTADGHQHHDAEARAFVKAMVEDLDRGEIERGYTYDNQKVRAESFMVAGNGPSIWVWFIRTEDGDFDHVYVEYCTSGAPVYEPIPAHKWATLHIALTAASKEL